MDKKIDIEIDGSQHYYDKLNSIKNNDRIKFQSCLNNKIELCVINTTESKNFKPERDIKYLKIIENIIEEKINGEGSSVGRARIHSLTSIL